jgi:hypothetical protein
METPTVNIGGDVALGYESVGSGPPVVLIHGAFISDTFTTDFRAGASRPIQVYQVFP